MSGRDRNHPCWCGSGQKLKKCHLNRESEKRPTIWDARAHFQKAASTKLCMHADASAVNCKGPIVRAHTVRRSADLSSIARDGHVYRSSSPDIADIDKNQGRIVPKLIGINHASTFLGFCSHHDSTTFSPIESEDLKLTTEQALLLSYRPLCRELYAKQRHLESVQFSAQADKGRSLAEQKRLQEIVSLMRQGVESSISDLRHAKKSHEEALRSSTYDQVRYAMIRFDRVPDVMCSALLQPHYTFDGKLIQNIGDIDRRMEFVSFSIAATSTGGAAVFSWLVDSDRASSMLVDSLLNLPRTSLANAVVRYALSNVENTYFRPEWWEELDEHRRLEASTRLRQNVGPFDTPPTTYLQDDGISYVDWSVVGVSEKRS